MLKGKLPGEGRFRVRQTFCPTKEGKMQKGKETGQRAVSPCNGLEMEQGCAYTVGYSAKWLAFWGGQLSRCTKLQFTCAQGHREGSQSRNHKKFLFLTLFFFFLSFHPHS